MSIDSELTHMQMNSDEKLELLGKAFRILRKMGFVAKKSKYDCQSCCIASLPEPTQGKMYYVFYATEDVDILKRTGRIGLSFGPLRMDMIKDDFDKEHVRAGELVVKALLDVGLQFDWDGTLEKRVVVI